jgi:hypothetical protein
VTVTEQDRVTDDDDLPLPTFLDRRAEAPADKGSGITNDRGGAAGAVKPKPSWRDRLPVHPAADLFPMMSDAALRELGEDIKKNGQKYPVVLWSDVGADSLLDGRNRLDAMELVGIPIFDKVDERLLVNWCYRDGDPFDLVLSFNVHRRHLTAEQRDELVEKVLKAKPEISDRAIAKQTKVDHKTVGKKRAKLVSRGEIPHVKTRTDTKGRKQPAAKSRNKVKGGGHVTSKPAKPPAQKSAEVSVEERRAQFAAMDSETIVDDQAVEILPPEIENSNPVWLAWSNATPTQRREFVKLNWDDIERERAAAHDGAA